MLAFRRENAVTLGVLRDRRQDWQLLDEASIWSLLLQDDDSLVGTRRDGSAARINRAEQPALQCQGLVCDGAKEAIRRHIVGRLIRSTFVYQVLRRIDSGEAELANLRPHLPAASRALAGDLCALSPVFDVRCIV